MNYSALSMDERKAILMGRLNSLVVFTTLVYAVLDRYLSINVAFSIYASFLLFAFINWLLIKYKHIEISKVFGLLAFNIMIFAIATSEPFTTGMHLQYVTAGAVALALYGYEQWKHAVFFVLLALVLDLMVFTMDFSIIPRRYVEEEQARIFFVLNTVIAASVSVYVFILNSKINYESELALQENEKVIRAKNDALKKVNAELDRFVYSASHDLRSPLSTLTGLINLSKMEKEDKMKLEYLDLMQNRIRSMDSFISEIIDYSRNSRLELKMEPINLKNCLQAILNDLQYTSGKERITIHCNIPDDLEINSDRSRLKIVFTNLISNAIKYHDPAKKEPWIKLCGEKNHRYVHIKVEDNGLGINSDLKDNVFDMFYRAHEHSSGSGLGLYIVKEALSKLSGSIQLMSKEGEGSVFSVTLPLQTKTVDAQEHSESTL
ncbi:MAG TPA: hypothetical protein DIS90_09685 [Cytophagales bacterium]|nr:hypothetical protein [Cytophagales bacterium]HCR55313.1 hypothetical protein [Cytophagales bacterium]